MNSDGWRRDGGIPLKNAFGHFCVVAKAARDPEAARDLCVRLGTTTAFVPQRGIERLCEHYAEKDVSAGASFVEALGMESNAGRLAQESLVPAWAKRDFPAVIKWMAEWEPGARDSILCLLARSLPERCVDVWRLLSPTAWPDLAVPPFNPPTEPAPPI